MVRWDKLSIDTMVSYKNITFKKISFTKVNIIQISGLTPVCTQLDFPVEKQLNISLVSECKYQCYGVTHGGSSCTNVYTQTDVRWL